MQVCMDRSHNYNKGVHNVGCPKAYIVQVSDGAGQNMLLPRTPKSIMKRKSALQPRIVEDVRITNAPA